MRLLTFSGRAGRMEFFLLSFVAIPLVSLVIFALFGAIAPDGILLVGLGILVGILTLWASIAVMVRRLHDLALSGWWVIPAFLMPAGIGVYAEALQPFCGLFVLCCLLAFMLLPGSKGINRFG